MKTVFAINTFLNRLRPSILIIILNIIWIILFNKLVEVTVCDAKLSKDWYNPPQCFTVIRKQLFEKLYITPIFLCKGSTLWISLSNVKNFRVRDPFRKEISMTLSSSSSRSSLSLKSMVSFALALSKVQVWDLYNTFDFLNEIIHRRRCNSLYLFILIEFNITNAMKWYSRNESICGSKSIILVSITSTYYCINAQHLGGY